MLGTSQQATPATWDRRKIKFHLSGFFGGGTPSKDNLDYWTDGTVPWVSPKDMKRRLIDTAEDLITVEAVKNSATNLVPPSSVLMVVRSGILKHSLPVALNTVPVALNQDMKAFRFRRSLLPEFFAYWIEGQQKQKLLEWRQIGATVDNIDVDAMLNGRIAVPDLPTQRQISDFLDRETARIDLLIEKRSRFAELVIERRKALISSAIIGAEDEETWLNNLPNGWVRQRAKVHFTESQQRSLTGEEELLTVSHITGVTKRSEKDVNMFLAESNEGYKVVELGDLVVNTMWAWMGAMGVSPEHGLISPSYGVYSPISNALKAEYVDLMVRSKPFVAEATRRSKGIHSSRLRLYPDAFLDMRLPVPPIHVQEQLLEELSSRIQREDKLLRKNERAAALLHEYRTTLITAAVTGQIDVATYAKSGSTDRRLDAIQEEMEA